MACALLVIAACGEDSVDLESVTNTVRPAAATEAPPNTEPVSEVPTTSTPTTPVTAAAPIDTTVGSTASATGVVVEVDGDLGGIDRFSIVLADGATLSLTPEPGLLFDNDGPLSHLRDHLISGNPVLVEFYEQEGSLFVAAVGDSQ